jgi:Ariadne domain
VLMFRCFRFPSGFFRCNRWVEQKDHESYDNESTPNTVDPSTAAMILAEQDTDPNTMAVTYGTARHESRTAKKRSTQMARFLHHYARWCAHAESAALERGMADSVCTRLNPVVQKAFDYNGDMHVFGGKGLSFVHAAFSELLECRSMLQHSYAFSYFQYKSTSDTKYKLMRRHINEKVKFEQFQSELELMTEQLSNVVARSHIRASQSQITFLTAATAEKRKDFSHVMIRILWDEKKYAVRDQEHNEKRQHRILSGGGVDTIVGLVSDPRQPLEDPLFVAGPHQRILPNRSSDESSDGADAVVAAAEAAADDAIRESLAALLAYNRITADPRTLMTSGGDAEEHDETSDWSCRACTYMNAGGHTRCEMCGTRR